MGNKSWQKLILLLLIAHQTTAKKWRTTVDGTQLVIHNAVLNGDNDLADEDFSNVETVKLEGAQSRMLTVGMQSPMANAKKLIVSGGKVQAVQVAGNFESILIENIPRLKSMVIDPNSAYNTVELTIKHAQLRKFPENISAMKNLRVLIFDNNFMSTLTMKDLNGLDSLRELRLVHNRIANINFFQAVLPKVEVIDLGSNLLKEINVNQFTAPLLSKLVLSENELESLDMSQFSSLSSLESLHVNNNQIDQITASSAALPKLRVFSIGFNYLSDISFENWNTPSLENLDISGNQFKKALGLPSVFPALQRVKLFPNSYDEEWISATLRELRARNIERN